MNGAKRPWPPLVVAEHVPRRVQWRDFLLTLAMWGLFFVLLEKELELFFSGLLKRLASGN